MNATSHIVAGSMPKISAISPAEGLSVDVTWSDGRRAGRTETVDLSPLINSFKIYKPLRKDRSFFETAHLIDNGETLAWGDHDQIDMAATSIERLAEETMSASDFQQFVNEQKLTHSSAAAMLGYSRRQIEHYLAGDKPIPRVFALACYALRVRNSPSRAHYIINASAPSTFSFMDIYKQHSFPQIAFAGPLKTQARLFGSHDAHSESQPATVVYDAP